VRVDVGGNSENMSVDVCENSEKASVENLKSLACAKVDEVEHENLEIANGPGNVHVDDGYKLQYSQHKPINTIRNTTQRSPARHSGSQSHHYSVELCAPLAVHESGQLLMVHDFRRHHSQVVLRIFDSLERIL